MSLNQNNKEPNSEKKLDKIDFKDSEIKEEKYQYIFLSRKMRIYIFILFLFLSVTVNLEYGIFNSSVDILQADLSMSNSEYGLFISISSTGRIIGLIIYMLLLNLKHRKYTLIISIFLNGSSYILYQVSHNIFILIFAKMLSAGNKVCGDIYRPIWIEQFGLSNYKSIFFSLIQVVGSYGQIIGFNLGSLLFKKRWKMGLLSILILMYIIVIGFLIIPGKFFFRNYVFYEEKNESNEDIALTDITIEKSNKNMKERKITLFADEKKSKKQKEKKKNTMINGIKKVLIDCLNMLKNPIYLLIILKRSIITFVLQIVYSYFKQYQEHVLYNVNEDLIIIFYNISSLVSNAIGGFISGMATKKLGGYENKKSIYIVIIPELITALIVGFLAFTKNFYVYNINLILFFCFV